MHTTTISSPLSARERTLYDAFADLPAGPDRPERYCDALHQIDLAELDRRRWEMLQGRQSELADRIEKHAFALLERNSGDAGALDRLCEAIGHDALCPSLRTPQAGDAEIDAALAEASAALDAANADAPELGVLLDAFARIERTRRYVREGRMIEEHAWELAGDILAAAPGYPETHGPSGGQGNAPAEPESNVIPFSPPAPGASPARAGGSLLRPATKPHVPLPWFDAAITGDRPAPARRWIVEDWLPIGRVTMLYADGGTGKTTLAQQLMTACATGTPWLGRPVAACRSVAILGEDDPGEIHFRQQQINGQLGIGMAELGRTTWFAGAGADNMLMTFDRAGAGATTQRFDELRQAALDQGARLVVIDAAAGTFGGGELDRSQVTVFVGGTLTRLAMELDGAVLLLGHPSQSGMAAGGSRYSGSSAWNNAVRSRWSFARPSADDEPDEDVRILSREKSNWSRRGVAIRVRWTGGAFLPVEGSGGPAGGAARPSSADVFLTLLRRFEDRGIRVSVSPNAGNHAPKLFAKQPDAHGYNRRQFDAAMQALLLMGRVHLVPYGKPALDRRELRTKPETAPSDDGEA